MAKTPELAPRFVTIEAAAQHLLLSRDTVRRMIRRNELAAVKIGRSIRVEVDSLNTVGEPMAIPKGN